MSGVLYIVATPIGHLDDISLRALSVLKAVDTIAAEDTRHSKRLLEHHGIQARLLSCHEHNESARSTELIEQLQQGNDVALIADAGTPLISDPGYPLVRAAREAGIAVTPIPGPSSIIAALSAAGLPTDRFYFGGFMSAKAQQRLTQLQALRDIAATLVLLESSHRIESLVAQLCEVFPRNHCVIAKELTKMHEQFLSGSPGELLQLLQQDSQLQKGEFVVLIDNGNRNMAVDKTVEDAELMRILLAQVPVKTAVNIATQLTQTKKNDLYQLALQLQDDSETKSL